MAISLRVTPGPVTMEGCGKGAVGSILLTLTLRERRRSNEGSNQQEALLDSERLGRRLGGYVDPGGTEGDVHMSTYTLWRRGRPGPLALITHDKQVRKVYGSNPAEAIEYLLDHPSEVALRDCFVMCEVLERKGDFPCAYSGEDDR